MFPIVRGFFHSTDHGLGLDIREAPSFGQRSKNQRQTGNVVTVEPGLDNQGTGGRSLGRRRDRDEKGLSKPSPNPQVP
jgi:hypothetical protein